jgi:hypothetical protein
VANVPGLRMFRGGECSSGECSGVANVPGWRIFPHSLYTPPASNGNGIAAAINFYKGREHERDSYTHAFKGCHGKCRASALGANATPNAMGADLATTNIDFVYLSLFKLINNAQLFFCFILSMLFVFVSLFL